jgi:hypothetical protein
LLQFLITVLQVVQFLGLELIDGFGIGRLILLVFLILGIELYLYGIQLVAQLFLQCLQFHGSGIALRHQSHQLGHVNVSEFLS